MPVLSQASHAGGRQVGAHKFRGDELWPIDMVARGPLVETLESVGLAIDAIFRSPACGFVSVTFVRSRLKKHVAPCLIV